MSYRFSLELQCASLFSPKISSQIKPAKFETFETETYFRRKTVSVAKKQNLLVRNCFRFQKKIHLSFKKVQHCPPFISCTLKLQAEALCTIALSFYRSQNVLCRSKIFEPAQKFECIQCLFKNVCAGTKTNFTECKSSFRLAQNVCDCHNM